MDVERVAIRGRSAVGFCLLADHLGSTAASTGGLVSGGSLMSRQKYYAYGQGRPGGTSPTPYGFAGQRRDASTGLMYYGARYYDPAIGVFAQADTVVSGAGNSQSFNRYAYAFDDPLGNTDPQRT